MSRLGWSSQENVFLVLNSTSAASILCRIQVAACVQAGLIVGRRVGRFSEMVAGAGAVTVEAVLLLQSTKEVVP